ncbi:hypothetical protein BDZ45DRAFT_70654 [Acephala macrosclerotiorum]|nr:hypothetical protein BDZ45DRAFT_70654 [Acephala macrosclerotiorum]
MCDRRRLLLFLQDFLFCPAPCFLCKPQLLLQTRIFHRSTVLERTTDKQKRSKVPTAWALGWSTIIKVGGFASHLQYLKGLAASQG